jgi:hypothetical protein
MFHINWQSLNEDFEKATLHSINDFLASLRETNQLPPQISDITVSKLSLGEEAPVIELYDICEPQIPTPDVSPIEPEPPGPDIDPYAMHSRSSHSNLHSTANANSQSHHPHHHSTLTTSAHPPAFFYAFTHLLSASQHAAAPKPSTTIGTPSSTTTLHDAHLHSSSIHDSHVKVDRKHSSASTASSTSSVDGSHASEKKPDLTSVLLSGLDLCIKLRVHYAGSASLHLCTGVHVQNLIALPIELTVSSLLVDGILCIEIDSTHDVLRIYFEPVPADDFDRFTGGASADAASVRSSASSAVEEADSFEIDDDDEDEEEGYFTGMNGSTSLSTPQGTVLHGICLTPQIGAASQHLSLGIEKLQYCIIDLVKRQFRQRLMYPNFVAHRGIRSLLTPKTGTMGPHVNANTSSNTNARVAMIRQQQQQQMHVMMRNSPSAVVSPTTSSHYGDVFGSPVPAEISETTLTDAEFGSGALLDDVVPVQGPS